MHGIGRVIPFVEIADDADGLGVGSPDRETHARGGAIVRGVRAEHAVAFVVGSFGVQVVFERSQFGGDGGLDYHNRYYGI